jgi:hypothetical protein
MCHAEQSVDVVPPLLHGPLVRLWSLEGVATTPWLLTMLLESPSTESEMFVEPYATVRHAQQRRPAQGGWEPVVWKKQLLPPLRNPLKSRRGAQRSALSLP